MEMKATRRAYGESLIELAKCDPRVVVLDADLAHATFTTLFRDAFPERHYNMGIAEANMVDVAAGMSGTGLVPFCSTQGICNKIVCKVRQLCLTEINSILVCQTIINHIKLSKSC